MSSFHTLDRNVINAWQTKKFADGRSINLGPTLTEQFFMVTPTGVFEILTTETGLRICTGGGKKRSEQSYATAPVVAFKTFARGHTHPRGTRHYKLEQTPGPEDGAIAKQAAKYGKPSYLIAAAACYRIFWTGKVFEITHIIGRKIRQSKLDKIAAEWLIAKPPTRICKRFPD